MMCARLRRSLGILLLAVGPATSVVAQTVWAETHFRPSTAELPNPERGFYVWAADDLLQWTQATADRQFQAGYRLVYAPVRLDAHANAPLPASLLTQLAERFSIARSVGLKLIPRFLYNHPAGETEYRDAQDAPLHRVLAHIEQLKPLLAEHADVIAFLQAGFVGAWGEWHSSSHDLTEPGPRTQIRDALLAALPAERFLQLRYPAYLMQWAPQLPSWRDRSAASRIGLHNDCFLASATDVGTYSDKAAERETERRYIAALSALAPFGAETCRPADAPGAVPRSDCKHILQEGRQFQLSYLNHAYYRTLFHQRWEAQGCMAELRRRLGYRFELQSLRHSAVLGRGQSGELQFTVHNRGWARAFNPRSVQLLLQHRASAALLPIPLPSVDPRAWLPGSTHRVSAVFSLPPEAAVGDYELLIALPDGASSLRQDARYSVRPANADNAASGQAWDAALGAFRTGSRLTLR